LLSKEEREARNLIVKHLYIVEKKSQNEIAVLLNMSKSGINYILSTNLNISNLRRSQDYDSRKYTINDLFFNKIDNELNAYWLGFLMADGYVNQNRNIVELALKDFDMIDFFKNDLDSTAPSRILIKKNVKKIIICSKRIVNDLVELGCVQKKSLILKFPIVPQHLEHHFIRGYFDGDGSVWWKTDKNQLVFSFMGTLDFMEKIQNRLSFLNSKAQIKKKNNENIYRYEISGNQKAKQFYIYLYKDATRFLLRKKQRFEQNPILI